MLIRFPDSIPEGSSPLSSASSERDRFRRTLSGCSMMYPSPLHDEQGVAMEKNRSFWDLSVPRM
jgi:hypothetical protein